MFRNSSIETEPRILAKLYYNVQHFCSFLLFLLRSSTTLGESWLRIPFASIYSSPSSSFMSNSNLMLLRSFCIFFFKVWHLSKDGNHHSYADLVNHHHHHVALQPWVGLGWLYNCFQFVRSFINSGSNGMFVFLRSAWMLSHSGASKWSFACTNLLPYQSYKSPIIAVVESSGDNSSHYLRLILLTTALNKSELLHPSQVPEPRHEL